VFLFLWLFVEDGSMLAFIPGLGMGEILVLLLIGVLLFGRKLPDIGRSLGKTVVEFKKGVSGLEEEVSAGGSARPAIEPEPVKPPQRVTPSGAPRFEDAPAAPASNLPPQV
jgi:sec-independent protein translocase protein TatA